MEKSFSYRKLETGWVKTHECEEIKAYNASFKEVYEIEEEGFEKVLILKEIEDDTWELNVAISEGDEEDFVEFEAISVRYCPYCSEYLHEGIEEIPAEVQLVMDGEK